MLHLMLEDIHVQQSFIVNMLKVALTCRVLFTYKDEKLSKPTVRAAHNFIGYNNLHNLNLYQ